MVHVIVMSSARGFSNLQIYSSSPGTHERNCPNLSFLKQATQPLLANIQANPTGRFGYTFIWVFVTSLRTLHGPVCLWTAFSPLPFERWVIANLLVESRNESALVLLFLLKYLPHWCFYSCGRICPTGTFIPAEESAFMLPRARLRQDGECHFFVPFSAKGSAPRVDSLIHGLQVLLALLGALEPLYSLTLSNMVIVIFH